MAEYLTGEEVRIEVYLARDEPIGSHSTCTVSLLLVCALMQLLNYLHFISKLRLELLLLLLQRLHIFLYIKKPALVFVSIVLNRPLIYLELLYFHFLLPN